MDRSVASFRDSFVSLIDEFTRLDALARELMVDYSRGFTELARRFYFPPETAMDRERRAIALRRALIRGL